MMGSGMGMADRTTVWAIVMAGPILAAAWGLSVWPVGWFGLPLIRAHPLGPSWWTGLLTALGFSLWYFTGFLAVMEAVWGA
jgi:hypothetical protein